MKPEFGSKRNRGSKSSEASVLPISLKVMRIVMSLPGRGIHLQKGLFPRGHPPQADLDPFLPPLSPGAQAIPLQLQGSMGTQVRHVAVATRLFVLWGREMDSKFPSGDPTLTPETQQKCILKQGVIIYISGPQLGIIGNI